MNGLDLNLTACVDKTASGNASPGTATGGDTIAGAIHFGGASASCTFDGTCTSGLIVNSGSQIINHGAETLTTGATWTAQSGASCAVNSGASFTIASGATCSIALASSCTLSTTTACHTTLALDAGSSIALTGPASLSANASCSVQILLGSGSYVNTASGGGQIQLGNNVGGSDLKLATANTRTLRQMLLPTGLPTNWATAVASGLDPYGITTTTAAPLQPLTIPITRLHTGATLSSVTMYFVVTSTGRGGSLPTMPSFSVFRRAVANGTASGPIARDSLFSGGSVSFPTPGSVSAYESSNQVQSWTMTCNQLNVIDSGHEYWIALQDEAGGAAVPGNLYLCVDLAYTAINDLRFA